MDDQGYLDLDIIVGFNRMQQLISYAYSVTHPEDAKDSASNEGSLDTVHPQMDAQWMRSYVHSCLSQSQTLESKVDGQQVMVRLSQGWEQWIIRNQVIPQLAKKIVTPPTSPPGQKDWEKSVLASPKPSSEATFASEEDLLDDALETLTLFSRLSLAETLECKNVHMCKMGKQLPEEEGVIGYLYDKESIDGYVEQSYQDFRTQALGDQSSQLMLSLYHFWSLFLQDRFVRNMYADFQQCALEEAVQGKREGLDLLYKFYLERLRKEWSQDLFLDFQQAALQDHEERQHNSGLVQVSQLLKNLKQKPALLPQLHELMEKALDSENIYS
ncbi:hypothetical protein EDD86DRAFT_204269 [Gorgonomyces haynaldii]|nr:hypothetical protein EDD86DRAFT_204269 [Gorgonomyces haynaldii]